MQINGSLIPAAAKRFLIASSNSHFKSPATRLSEHHTLKVSSTPNPSNRVTGQPSIFCVLGLLPAISRRIARARSRSESRLMTTATEHIDRASSRVKLIGGLAGHDAIGHDHPAIIIRLNDGITKAQTLDLSGFQTCGCCHLQAITDIKGTIKQ